MIVGTVANARSLVTNGDIAFRSISAPGTISGATVAPGTPAGLVNTDGVLICVIHKAVISTTSTISTPAGWTKLVDLYGGGGVAGAGSGPSGLTWFFREKDASWSTVPGITMTNVNVAMAVAVAYSKSGGVWQVAAGGGEYGVSALTNNPTVTLPVDPGLQTKDRAIGSFSMQATIVTWNTESFSAPGVASFGAVGERVELDTSFGADLSGVVFDAPVTDGLGTGPPTIATLFGSSSGRGCGALVRLRAAA